MTVEAVHVLRGEIPESIHRADVAVADDKGKIVAWLGYPAKITYMRSASKPIQAIPLVESGALDHFGLTDKELAIICASHSGEQEHLDTVQSILEKIGLKEDCLQCGTHPPLDSATRRQMIREDRAPTASGHNCSGKHAGFLALCVYRGYPTDGYLLPDHPVQQEVLGVIAEFTDMLPENIVLAVDGCGVPVYALPLWRMAMSFARLATGYNMSEQRAAACQRIINSMWAHPHMVGGRKRLCTELLSRFPGRVLAKVGAEAVYCMSLPELGLGVAIKMEDGAERGLAPTVIAVLEQLGVLSRTELDDLAKFSSPKVLNSRGQVVGRIKAVFELLKLSDWE